MPLLGVQEFDQCFFT